MSPKARLEPRDDDDDDGDDLGDRSLDQLQDALQRRFPRHAGAGRVGGIDHDRADNRGNQHHCGRCEPRSASARSAYGIRLLRSNGVKDWAPERLQHVVAVASRLATSSSRVEPAVGAATVEERHDVDRLNDQVARHGDDGLLHKLLQPQEPSRRRVGVHGGDAARVACVPGLEHVESFWAAHFADDDAVGSRPERRAHQVGECCHARLGAQCHAIGGGAFELACIFQDRRLARRGRRSRPTVR